MPNPTITLQVPESLYQRLVNTANAVGRSLDDIMLQALTVGSPPDWHDVPEEFQTELAALDRLDNQSLWKIAQSHKTPAEMERYSLLLEKKQEETLTEAEQLELAKLRHEADLFMLRKAQATVLLRWRGERLQRSLISFGGTIINNNFQLIQGEGKVGTYGELLKTGRRGDNLTPHHLPSNAYMKAKVQGYTTNQGIAIMIEHLSPGKGGRHRQTLSYGRTPDLNLSTRQTLAKEIWDLRFIYVSQGLYNSEIRKSLRELIKLNKLAWIEIFNK